MKIVIDNVPSDIHIYAIGADGTMIFRDIDSNQLVPDIRNKSDFHFYVGKTGESRDTIQKNKKNLPLNYVPQEREGRAKNKQNLEEYMKNSLIQQIATIKEEQDKENQKKREAYEKAQAERLHDKNNTTYEYSTQKNDYGKVTKVLDAHGDIIREKPNDCIIGESVQYDNGLLKIYVCKNDQGGSYLQDVVINMHTGKVMIFDTLAGSTFIKENCFYRYGNRDQAIWYTSRLEKLGEGESRGSVVLPNGKHKIVNTVGGTLYDQEFDELIAYIPNPDNTRFIGYIVKNNNTIHSIIIK